MAKMLLLFHSSSTRCSRITGHPELNLFDRHHGHKHKHVVNVSCVGSWIGHMRIRVTSYELERRLETEQHTSGIKSKFEVC